MKIIFYILLAILALVAILFIYGFVSTFYKLATGKISKEEQEEILATAKREEERKKAKKEQQKILDNIFSNGITIHGTIEIKEKK